MELISKIEAAILDAENLKSNTNDTAFNVPALVSIRGRHLLNNLGALGTNYLECGCHVGGSTSSVLCQNKNIKSAYVVDSFESDKTSGRSCFAEFEQNIQPFLGDYFFKLIVSDCFEVDLSDIEHSIDLFLYDAGHTELDQKRALTYYYKALADTFIFIVDDYDWPEVQKGTQAGIQECGFKVLFENHIKSEGSHSNDSYWNGYYIALLQKQ